MNSFDVTCIIISIPLFLSGLRDMIWWIRFRRIGRFTRTGVVLFHIDEGKA